MRKILEEEMMLAQGCTEPIAAAYTASMAKEILENEVSKMKVRASINIIKNAKGVIIPGTSDMCGIVPSAIFGVLCGDYKLEMEVLDDMNDRAKMKCKNLINEGFCELEVVDTPAKLFIEIIVWDEDGNNATCKVIHQHTNVVEQTKNGEIIFAKSFDEEDSTINERVGFTITNIYDYVNTIDVSELQIVKDQIYYNEQIAVEGASNIYSLCIFQKSFVETVSSSLKFDIRRKAAALAAAGSDARMSGCTLPVMTLNGSGNQGIAACIPVITYGEYLQCEEEKIIRAVAFSDLIAIRIKEGIGRLSPMCGVVPAGIGAVAGIMYLYNNSYTQIVNMIQNTIANNTGVICDGAKPSCALKIYSALEVGLLSAQLAINDSVVQSYTGIIDEDVEQTIDNLGIISVAMNDIDKQIIKIMTK